MAANNRPSKNKMDSDTKLKILELYIKRGWPLFPCGSDKKPLTEHGFYDATLDIKQIQVWHEQYPNANWGMPTGPATEGGAGLVVIDIDKHEDKGVNGFLAWNQLREEHSDPMHTVTVRTGEGVASYISNIRMDTL